MRQGRLPANLLSLIVCRRSWTSSKLIMIMLCMFALSLMDDILQQYVCLLQVLTATRLTWTIKFWCPYILWPGYAFSIGQLAHCICLSMVKGRIITKHRDELQRSCIDLLFIRGHYRGHSCNNTCTRLACIYQLLRTIVRLWLDPFNVR